MLLYYLGTGPRDYAKRPYPIEVRGVWEFQAIIAGKAEPLLPRPMHGLPQESRIWVFAPQCAHGWTSPPHAGCRVMVMHFSSGVCEALQRAVAGSGFHHAPLDANAIARLESLADQLAEEIAAPSDRGEALYQLVLAEVSLLALANLPPRRLQHGIELARHRVESACAWFAEHMSEAPGFEEVAAAVRISPAHLRRMFLQVTGRSPRTALDRLRYQRACELLADPDRRIADIATACGFSEASVLSRGFRIHTGRSPHDWRKFRLHPGYRRTQPNS